MCKKSLKTVMAVLVLGLCLAGTASSYEVLIDDGFDNEDLATGGINGGFSLVTNSQGEDCTAFESGSVVEVNMVGPKRPAAAIVVSNECFDPLSEAALAEGLTVRWEVDSIKNHADGWANGFQYMLQSAPVFFTDTNDIALKFSGWNGNSVSFQCHDANETEPIPYAAGSELDGFACEFTINAMGWSYEVTGLNALPLDPNDPNDLGAPTVITDSGTWADLGVSETYLTDTLDNDCHASAFSQEWGNIVNYDRCTVSIGEIPIDEVPIYEVLIDDDFDNEDLATGGINGGFTLVTNDPWGVDCNAVETESHVAVDMVGPKRPAAAIIISNGTFDPLSEAALAKGLNVKWEVNSLLNPTLYANGNIYMVQTEPVFFNDSNNIGLKFGGSGGNNVRFFYDDNDSLNGESESQPYAAGSELDGFTCEFTISEMGWSYEVTGLNAPGDPNDPNDTGEPTIISDSGIWTDLGLPETFLTDTLDNDCHVSVFAQEWGNIVIYDRCTVWIKEGAALQSEDPADPLE